MTPSEREAGNEVLRAFIHQMADACVCDISRKFELIGVELSSAERALLRDMMMDFIEKTSHPKDKSQ